MFEFHDSVFSLESFDRKDLIVSVKHLNIHEDAKENSHDCDMEITSATISFQNIHILSLEPMRAYQLDANGNWYTDEPQIIFTGKDAEEKFINELENGFSINYIDIRHLGEHTTIEIGTNSPKYFIAIFSFSNVSVEWDAYCKKAWYTLHKCYRYEITLLTPHGEQKIPLHVSCNQEDETHPAISLCTKYKDQEIQVYGKDYLWIDAWADLQKHLPEGVILKCCLTCRHGNMCPFGNKPGEVFCTKGIEIMTKNDMCDWFDYTKNGTEIEKRSRRYADTCEDYKHQSWDFYTYNDYLYELNK
ncbi:MAG: hypothetical protein HFE78_02580 [Clostridiales bacterium]|nr:hypothetical protein [Clostridiales bacterium]